MFCPPAAQRAEGKQAGSRSAAAKSFIVVQPASLPLMALKQAEGTNGFVFRFCDFTGTAGKLRLTLPRPAAEVFTCNLVEANAEKTQARGETVTAPVRPFSPATLKVRFAPYHQVQE